MNRKGFPGEFRNILNEDEIYTPSDIEKVFDKVRKIFSFSYTKTKVKYFNVPCAFDIETTSFFRSTENEEPEKIAIMYVWTFGIFGCIIMGRTWEEYKTMINKIESILDLNENKRLIIYCHNLAYEFQFMRKWFKWKNVFAIDNHKPIYALTNTGIEYRCSLLLSGYSLNTLAKNLQTYKIDKLVGDLDYSLLRHSKTPLTEKEIGYCVNDVKIVLAYISECIENDGGISQIPLTKTGYVRKYCRNSCFYTPGVPRKKDYKRLRYLDIIKRLRLTGDEYKQLKRAFQGGFTHANPFATGKVFKDVTSYDFTSSYPCVMIAEQFPMSSSEKIDNITQDEFYKSLRLYCCVFDIEFINISPQIWSDNYISSSRCWVKENAILNNGRIVSAVKLCTTITETDFMIIHKFYKWDKFRVSNFRRYKKGYLPTDFVKAILKLYQDKTTLKGVAGKEVEYLQSKEMLNSCYGMCVTDIVREEFIYQENRWLESSEKPVIDTDEAIKRYNNNRGRFLFYPWGVWVTAYARRNLFSGILEFGEDYLYSDTDSIKVLNIENHMEYINGYNVRIKKQLQTALEYHKIDITEIEPKTKKGIKKCLGVWDFDGNYSRFKTLGAKRYMVEYSQDNRNKEEDRGKINITVAGLNKQKCVPWMISQWGNDNIFEHFNNDLYVPPAFTGKNVHTYIEDEKRGTLIDYMGNENEYRELSSVHLGEAEYTLKLSKEYVDYIKEIRNDEW